MRPTAPFPTMLVREGSAELEVPAVPHRRGPGRHGRVPFYNPTMAINRDVTVALLAARPAKGRFLDGLTATGATGIRVALEAPGNDVVLNDANPQAAELARRNVLRNALNLRVEHRRLRALLAEDRFGHVDVDPFGSPAPFLDPAIHSLKGGGRLSVTATDVATLGGLHSRTAARRYGAAVVRTGFTSEVAVRGLLGVVVRGAARYDVGVAPVCAFAAEHFVRAHVELLPGARGADASLAQIGWARFAEVGGFTPAGLGPDAGGPLWLGALGETTTIRAMEDRAPRAEAGRLLATLRAELGFPPFYADVGEIARAHRISPPSMRRVLEELRLQGFRAARTHFSPTGVKSDASRTEIARIVGEVGARTGGA